MEGFDLSRHGIAHLSQLSHDIIAQLEAHTRGYALSLAENRLTRVTGIHLLQHVVQLDLSQNRLVELSGLESLVALQQLNLSQNNLSSVEALVTLRRLQVLNLSENNLETIDGLQSLLNLRSLDVSYNNLTHWPALSSLHQLENLNLASNILPSFPPHTMLTLFPTSLQRLSLTQNSMREICGLVALGFHLRSLELLEIDGNPVVLEHREALGLLMTNFFPSTVRFDVVVKESELLPRSLLQELQQVVRLGDERTLWRLLQPVITKPPMFKVEQVSFPSVVEEMVAAAPRVRYEDLASSSSTALSKENKMELWKQMTEKRKLEDQRRTVPLPPDTIKDQAMLPPPPPVAPIMQPPLYPPPSMVLPPPVTSQPQSLPVPQAVTTSEPSIDPQIKTLQDQVYSMRKYIKVWIKREQMLRQSAASRIGRWYRRLRFHRALDQRITAKRIEWHRRYSLQVTATCFHPQTGARTPWTDATKTIQRLTRGFLVRRRVSRWKQLHQAAKRLQRVWRRYAEPKHHEACASYHQFAELQRQLETTQRACVAQTKAIETLWSEMNRYRRFFYAKWIRAIIQLQRQWRRRKRQRQTTASKVDPKPAVIGTNRQWEDQIDQLTTLVTAQAASIAQLQQQMQDLLALQTSSSIPKEPKEPAVVTTATIMLDEYKVL